MPENKATPSLPESPVAQVSQSSLEMSTQGLQPEEEHERFTRIRRAFGALTLVASLGMGVQGVSHGVDTIQDVMRSDNPKELILSSPALKDSKPVSHNNIEMKRFVHDRNLAYGDLALSAGLGLGARKIWGALPKRNKRKKRS